MPARQWPTAHRAFSAPTLIVVAFLALLVAGCSAATTQSRDDGQATSAQYAKALKFSECMRKYGVKEFPDPDASGGLTIDQVVNGSSIDTQSASWKRAIDACHDLRPAGFEGHRRNADDQKKALQFAQCVRGNGVKDFPDPDPDGPLVDTNHIPSSGSDEGMSALNAAMKKCGDIMGDALGTPR